MPTASTIKTTLLAALAFCALAVAGSAQAAVVPPFHGDAFTRQTPVTPVYWVWRHHHKIWIPDHHHGY
jgi:hypothetical protein